MQKEPLAVTTVIRVLIYEMLAGFAVFGVWEPSVEQFGWIMGGGVVIIESIMWLITRSEVWSPAGAPTHPPTEALWSSKVAAAEAAGAHALDTQKAEYEGRLAATTSALAVAVDGEFATVPSGGGRHVAPLSQETHEAQVDTVNPGQEANQ